MSLLDKLKNALFEEEYVEVEEKKESKKKESPIAKKIIIDEPRPKKINQYEEITVEEEKKDQNDFKFKAILDDDFTDIETPKKKEKIIKPIEKEPKHQRKEKTLYKEEKHQEEIKPYNAYKEIKMYEYGNISRQKEKKEFKPSPIISPIYGVLDQNYKKEDIVTKKEVRITSSYKSKNIDVDSVRKKAYGNSDDIFEEELTSSKPKVETDIIKEEESLLDISNDDTPTVAKVTMGDAEEYYSDLGLEYNVDYKDESHEKATGRRTDLNKIGEETQKNNETSIEDNLFDLIDSMYDEKKGE